jgi:hypothetical protein
MKRWEKSLICFCVSVFLITLVGCGGGEEAPTAISDTQPPTATIAQPLNQTVIPPGQVVQVEVIAMDDQAVKRVELYLDNSLIESRVVPEGSMLTTTRELFGWSAASIGSHTLQARVYDAAGQMGASPVVTVQVQSADMPTITSTSDAGGEPAASPTVAPTQPPQATATPAPESAAVTANLNANLRSGPGTNYAVAGGLREGERADVTGRNNDSSWWQISFQGGTAWIANAVVTANSEAYNAPVVSAPPPPAPTDTPVPPTATPVPVTATPATGLRVDQSSLAAGQCTTLRWDFADIRALYISFGYGYDKEGVPGNGTRQVCPSVSTTYEATVVNHDSSQSNHSVTVNVSGQGCGDPVIDRFVSTTYDVAAGQNFSIFWDVRCAKNNTVKLFAGSAFDTHSASGSKEFSISDDTVFRLEVQKDDGNFVYASFTVNIR